MPAHREVERDEDYEPRRPTTTTTSLRIVTAVMALFFGYLGVHKFMQGNSGAGVVRILITLTCIGFYANCFISFIEAIIYLCRSNESYEEAYIRQKQGWF
jgi:TM2 domain-containing membrane protein YozV